MNVKNRQRFKPRRNKLFLPLILIIFLLTVVGINFLKKQNPVLGIFSQKMVNPQITPSAEENFRTLLGEYGFIPEGLSFEENQITVILPGGTTILFPRGGDLKFQVASLQFIISRSKIDGRLLKKVDLRFEKPVVVYQ